MAILQNQVVLFDGYNLTTKLSAVAMDFGCETLDDTVLNDTYRSNAAGLITTAANIDGFYSSAEDVILKNNVGVQDKPFSVLNASTEGSVAHFFKMMEGSYEPIKGSVGDLHQFSAGGVGTGRLIRGQVIANKTGITTSGSGTKFQLGGLNPDKTIYVALHVLAASGSPRNLIVSIQSDNDDTAGGETTRITFSSATGASSQWAEFSNAGVTSTWWNAAWTVTGTNPSYDFIVVAGVL